MREDELFRMVFFGILACGTAWDIYSRFDAEIGKEREGRSLLQQRYMPLISGALLPAILLTSAAFSICLAGPIKTFRLLLPLLFTLFSAEQPVLRIAAAGDAFSAQADQCTHLRRSVAAADLSLLYILHCHGTV